MQNREINTKLTIIRGEPVVLSQESGKITTQQDLLNFLRDKIKEKEIKSFTPIYQNGHTIYKFKVFNNNTYEYLDFNISVKNSEKHLFLKTINTIKDLTNHLGTIKKFNRAKFAAGFIAGTILFTLAAPHIAKGLDRVLEKEDQIYDNQKPKKVFNITEEDKIKLEQEYMNDLIMRAQNGDEEAKRELRVHYAIEELKKEPENSQDEINNGSHMYR